MSDTTACPTCGAGVPAGAAFCTSCGNRLEPAPETTAPTPPPPPGAPPSDATVVETPGLNDHTRVLADVEPQPVAPIAPPTPLPAPGTWSPDAVPTGPAGTAPWNPPASPPPPTWQQPAPPPGTSAGPAYGPPAGAPAGVPPSMWGSQPVMAPPTKTSRRAPSLLGGLAAIAGGLLTIVGVFSGWVTLVVGGDSETVTAWSLTGGEGLLESQDPYVIVALGALALVVGLLLILGAARTFVRLAAVVVGAAIVGIVALNWMSIADFVADTPAVFASSDTAETAIGFYLAIAGGVVTVLSALLPAKK